MQVTVTIPEKEKTQEVILFELTARDKMVGVYVSSEDGTQKFDIDVSTLWAAATASQKTVIRTFFKRVGALALDAKNEADNVDVVDTDVTGDIFED